MSLRDGFSGDQALFLTFAKAIDKGAILYRDVWDIKQPGIFAFYYLAGKLFGFTEIGIHAFELIYWLSFGALLTFGLRKYFTCSLFAALTPLLSIGIYYTVSGSFHWTQVEALVCMPLFLSLWFCQKFLENTRRKSYLVLSGIFSGIVLVFKLMFVLMLSAFWLWFIVFCFYLFDKNIKRISIFAGLISLGILIPIALVVIYFAAIGALGDLYYTTFIYPVDAFKTITKMENRTGILIEGLMWFVKSYFPVIVFTLLFPLINIKFFFKERQYKKEFFARSGNFLFGGLFLWVVFGFVVILIQRLSWWEYHYSLLMIPLGILAAKCLERFVEEIQLSRRISRKPLAFMLLSLAVALAFVPTARRLVKKVREAANIQVIELGDRKFSVTGDAAPDYESISADTAFLRKETPKAAIFVVSNPLYYYLSGSMPVFSANGAMSDMFTASEWLRLDREMSEKPPKYIFIETRLLQLIMEENPGFIKTIEEDYSIYSTGERGSFYKRKE